MGRPFKVGDEVKLTRQASRDLNGKPGATAKVVSGDRLVVLVEPALGGFHSHEVAHLELVRKTGESHAARAMICWRKCASATIWCASLWLAVLPRRSAVLAVRTRGRLAN